MSGGFKRRKSAAEPDPRQVQSFIEAAGTRREAQDAPPADGRRRRAEQAPPWQRETLREDVKRTFNLRLPEPLAVMLRYIAEHSRHSQHGFCLEVLEPAIRAEAERLYGERRE